MILQPAGEKLGSINDRWQGEYIRHLEQRLAASMAYIRANPPLENRKHARSFLALLAETHHYPALTAQALEFIAALHLLPGRWGLAYAWEPELRFAIHHTPGDDAGRLAAYHCALGDLLLVEGRFDEAIEECRVVLAMPAIPDELNAHAGRIAFLSLRFSGRSEEAEQILKQGCAQFLTGRPADDVVPEQASAWLVCNQSRLELLREKSQTEAAHALVDEMIALDRTLGIPDPVRTADLLTHRSTLLWMRSRYPEAIADLNACIQLYYEAGDYLNAESRQSNLGLVYWLMGDLVPAEANTRAALSLYRKIGLDQMLTYASGNLGLICFCRGDLDGGRFYFEEQITVAKKRKYLREEYRGAWNLALLDFYQGHVDRLKEVYDATLEYYNSRGNLDVLYLHANWMALYYEKTGAHEKALEIAREGVRVARENDLPRLEQISLRSLANLLPREEREAPLRRSLALAEGCGRGLEIAAAWLMLANVMTDAPQRLAAWQTGRDMLVENGAEQWLEGASMDAPPFLPAFL